MSAPSCVHPFLDASTAHITKNDNDLLTANITPSRVIEHDYGWFIHVSLDEASEQDAQWKEAGFSESLLKLLAFARSYGCWWINLDSDAEQIEGLDLHNW